MKADEGMKTDEGIMLQLKGYALLLEEIRANEQHYIDDLFYSNQT